jgi:hypothetical protein
VHTHSTRRTRSTLGLLCRALVPRRGGLLFQKAPPTFAWAVLVHVSCARRAQAFNCVLPAHAPEEDAKGQPPAAALAAFLPSGK